MTDFIQVFTTIDSEEGARRIAGALVEQGLAACVQVLGPIASTYRWKGKIEKAEEWLCIIKTGRQHWENLEAEIRRMHPYEVPEIIAVPILTGSAAYLEWLSGEPGRDG